MPPCRCSKCNARSCCSLPVHTKMAWASKRSLRLRRRSRRRRAGEGRSSWRLRRTRLKQKTGDGHFKGAMRRRLGNPKNARPTMREINAVERFSIDFLPLFITGLSTGKNSFCVIGDYFEAAPKLRFILQLPSPCPGGPLRLGPGSGGAWGDGKGEF